MQHPFFIQQVTFDVGDSKLYSDKGIIKSHYCGNKGTMRGSRNFCQGSPGLTARKQSGKHFFLVLNLFYTLQRGPMVLL